MPEPDTGGPRRRSAQGGRHLCAFRSLCLSAWGSRVVAPMQVPSAAHLHTSAPWQPLSRFQCLRAPMVWPSRKFCVSHPPPCQGQEATQPPLVPLLERRKSTKPSSQWGWEQVRRHWEHLALPLSGLLLASDPALCCVCPGLQQEEAQRK